MSINSKNIMQEELKFRSYGRFTWWFAWNDGHKACNTLVRIHIKRIIDSNKWTQPIHWLRWTLDSVLMRLSRLLGLRKFLVHLPSRVVPKKVENFSISCEFWYNFCELRKISVLSTTMSIENSIVGASTDSVNIKNLHHF